MTTEHVGFMSSEGRAGCGSGKSEQDTRLAEPHLRGSCLSPAVILAFDRRGRHTLRDDVESSTLGVGETAAAGWGDATSQVEPKSRKSVVENVGSRGGSRSPAAQLAFQNLLILRAHYISSHVNSG